MTHNRQDIVDALNAVVKAEAAMSAEASNYHGNPEGVRGAYEYAHTRLARMLGIAVTFESVAGEYADDVLVARYSA